jgi:hypothetical protein
MAYFPDLVTVTGTQDQLVALRGVPGFVAEDHGRMLFDDGRFSVVAYTSHEDTARMVAQIQSLGLDVSVMGAADQKALMQAPPGPDLEDGGGTG